MRYYENLHEIAGTYLMLDIEHNVGITDYAPAVEPHITIFSVKETHVLDGDYEDVRETVSEIFKTLEVPSLKVDVIGLELFEPSAVVLLLDSPELMDLRQEVETMFFKNCPAQIAPFEFSFRPHLTLGLLDEGETLPDFKGEFSFRTSELMFSSTGK